MSSEFKNPTTQAERRAVPKNDERQSTTYFELQRVSQELGGRYAQADTVAGAEPFVRYPAASSPWGTRLPDEPSLGFSVEYREPVGTAAEVAASLAALSAPAPTKAPSPAVVETTDSAAKLEAKPLKRRSL
jgi:hypothetical protein